MPLADFLRLANPFLPVSLAFHLHYDALGFADGFLFYYFNLPAGFLIPLEYNICINIIIIYVS